MSKYGEAIESIKLLAARLEGITQVANALERIGSLEDAEAAANSRCAHARKEAASAEATLLAARNAVQDAEDRARNLVPNAEAHAARIVAEAKERAEAIIADANAKATAKNRECVDLEARVVAARTELATLTQRIAMAKKKMAELLA